MRTPQRSLMCLFILAGMLNMVFAARGNASPLQDHEIVGPHPNGSTPARPVPAGTVLMPDILTSDYQADFGPLIANGKHEVAWGKNRLVSFGLGEMKEPVSLFDRSGKWEFEAFPTIQNALKTYAQDAAVTNSGKVVLAMSVLSQDGASADMIVEV